jgi:hypothetical protein
MSFRDIIKKTGLIELDEPKEEKVTPTVENRPVSSTPSKFASYSVPANPVSVAASAPPSPAMATEVIAALTDAMNAAKNPGYVEFQKIFNTLNGLPESQRYAMAINLLSVTMKIDPDSLLASFDERAALLEAERTGFNTFCDDETQSKVIARQNEVAEVEKTIEQKRQEIAALEQKRVELTEAANNAQVDIQHRQVGFTVAYQSLNTQLAAERSHILPFSPSTKTNDHS